jgi:HEAT repeats
VQELARGWKDEPDTLPMLKRRAESDEDNDVRCAAVQELAWGWKDESATFDVLCHCAINDSFERQYDFQDLPRQVALEILVRQYVTHPKTLELLHDRALNDPDDQLRTWAQEQLKLLEANP